MPKQVDHLRRLIAIHLANQKLLAEGRELFSYLKGKSYEAEITDLLDVAYANQTVQPYDVPLWDTVFQRIEKQLDDPKNIASHSTDIKNQRLKTRKFKPGRIFTIAAILTILLAAPFIIYKIYHKQDLTEAVTKSNIKPGRNGATLTLANGKQIQLDEQGTGQLAKESGVTITKNDKGEIIYSINDSNQSNSQKLNTLTTTNGETATVIFQDGTKVWLNAASSISYPSSFAAASRREVNLSGEAYFEVSPNKKQPFIVISKKQEVEVLGTHFNISSYETESSTLTTLLEGSVKVASQTTSLTLQPSEQANTNPNGSISKKTVNADQTIMWTRGFFTMENETLNSMMLKIGRWYNVTIEFEDKDLKEDRIGGTLSRYESLDKVLKTIERSGRVKFTLTGRTLYVSKAD